jgi:RES domain-containing protein
VLAYRILQRKNEATAFTGEAARRFGGRWNSVGVPVVYTASSLALGVLEVIVNARRRIPPGSVYVGLVIPQTLEIERVDVGALPSRWYAAPAPAALRLIGDAWVKRGASVALLVPSAIARIEFNILSIPGTLTFAKLKEAKCTICRLTSGYNGHRVVADR